MNKIKHGILAMATASSLFAVGSAEATLQNWYLDTDGAGSNAAVLVADYIDLNGQAYVNNSFTSSTDFNFNEAGSFLSVLADSSTPLSPLLTSTFFGSGFGTTGGDLTFSSGTLTINNGTTDIGVFNLTSGSAVLQANSTLPNGTVSLIFEATSLASGYFFDSGMNDLSDVLSSPEGLLFGFATTNVIDLSQDSLDADGNVVDGNVDVRSDLVAAYNSEFGTAFGTVDANQTTDLYISNNGQFRMSVPEPASLALLGLGLLGLGAGARRKKA